jgi:8-oxo-dGTP pyrophosphatase MutT (NUDIX family)
MRWTVHGERSLYESDWVRLLMADVELPDGTRLDHHVVRLPAEGAGVVVADPARGVLLLYRHRFITDAWGWEIPAGRVEAGESVEEAAARETLEETGWRAGSLRTLVTYHPVSGIGDATFHLLLADGAEHVGEPVDAHEVERVAWFGVDELGELVRRGEVRNGLSLTALLWFLLYEAAPSRTGGGPSAPPPQGREATLS